MSLAIYFGATIVNLNEMILRTPGFDLCWVVVWNISWPVFCSCFDYNFHVNPQLKPQKKLVYNVNYYLLVRLIIVLIKLLSNKVSTFPYLCQLASTLQFQMIAINFYCLFPSDKTKQNTQNTKSVCITIEHVILILFKTLSLRHDNLSVW
jgi:hypothetical protein